MTRKHFNAIARAIAEARILTHEPMGPKDGIDAVAKRIASVMAQFNPNFDRERFLAACKEDDRPEAHCSRCGQVFVERCLCGAG